MATFSERMGIKPVKSAVQVDSMDDALRNRLWSALAIRYWHVGVLWVHPDDIDDIDMSWTDAEKAEIDSYITVAENNFLWAVWDRHFKKPLDDKPDNWQEARSVIKDFFFACPWYEVYDFIEFVANNYDNHSSTNRAFITDCNTILEEEMAGYRFVGGKIAPITSAQEIAAIEAAQTAAAASTRLAPVHEHLELALARLSDRRQPDYRNSIKESISSVESLCKLIAGDEHGTLTTALNAIATAGKVEMHDNLKKALKELYWYTSDAEGIRHGLMDAPNLGVEDALFMLVSCSGFVSYLIAKAQKAGISV